MSAPTGLTGTPRLTRLALRRDRVTLPTWILALGLFVAATTAMFVDSLALRADLVRETQLVATNAGMRMLGLTSGPSVGGYMLHREYVTLAVLAVLMSTLAVVRHTRQNEELARSEMVGATVVGRYAGLAAAVIVTVGANIALSAVLALAMALNGLPVAASILAGASVAGLGLAGVGVAAVSCQLVSTTRGATGLTSAVLGLWFLLSGVGNMLGTVDRGLSVTSAWPVWLSPIGWGQQTRPFGAGHWSPLVLCVVLLALLLTVAFILVDRRDVGRGLWPERRGPAQASARLLSPVGLAWRLQRGTLLGWAVALLGFGLIFGTVSEQIQDVQGPAAVYYARMGGSAQVVDAYEASMVAMAGMFAAIYVVQVLLRLRVDESGGTLEPLLATGVSRTRWLLSHALTAAAGATLLVLLFSVSMGLTAGQVLGSTPTQVWEMSTAALVQLPGILVIGGVCAVLVAVVPRWAVAASWTLLVAALVLGPMFGPTLRLPQWAQDLSPFTHIPKVPATSLTSLPLLALAGITVALLAAAIAAARRRNLLLPA